MRRCPPRRPIQFYLRRPPPPDHPTLRARCTAANALMEASNRTVLENIVRTCQQQGPVRGQAWLDKPVCLCVCALVSVPVRYACRGFDHVLSDVCAR